jgi:hypothetical protein
MKGTNLLNNMFDGFSRLPLSDKEYFFEIIKKGLLKNKEINFR